MKQAGFYVGWSQEDITPGESVALFGQYYERLSTHVQSPLTVTACAMESVQEDGTVEQAIMISMDLLCSYTALQTALKQLISQQLPDVDTRKLFLHATHTHSAPHPDVATPYGQFLLGQLVKATIVAWNNRQPAGISAGLGYAVTGHNRRVRYADGSAEMYGRVDRPDFIGMEGTSDPGVAMLFCWDTTGALTGVLMNVGCPAQVTEAKYVVSADFWDEVRTQLWQRFKRPIFVLAQCGAAGDVSPRDLPRGYKAGEPNMWDVPGIIEIGKRLAHAFDTVYAEAKNAIQTSVHFRHLVANIAIPTRVIPEDEYQQALRVSADIHGREPADPTSPETAWNRFVAEVRANEQTNQYGPWDNKNTDYGIVRKKDATINLYRNHAARPTYPMELHVLRINDIAIASNAFELFVDFGYRIMAQSKARQTFIVQLSGDYGDYLATDRAIQAGGYSAMANPVGPEGGRFLVDQTVAAINSLWDS